MNEQTESVVKKPARGKFVILFLILLLASTFLLSYPLWQKFAHWQQESTQQIDNLNKQVSTLQIELQALQSQDNQAPLEALQTQLNELSNQQRSLENHFITLNAKIASQPQYDDDWKLAEIQYLLTIALHRLQLEHDSEGALVALVAAEARLRRLNNSSLFQVRAQMLADIKRLREIERPDIAGLAVRLAQHMAQANDLPLLQGNRQTDIPSKQEEMSEEVLSWQEQLFAEAKELVVIRYNDKVDTGFLTPGQRSLVVQTLLLKLENARFFLLRRDSPNFSASIQAVRNWLERYYDINSNKIKVLQKYLADVQNITLAPQLLDISGSLRQLQSWRQAAQAQNTDNQQLQSIPLTLPPAKTETITQ
jgi:uroporphyrin-3 C-methyltransferase